MVCEFQQKLARPPGLEPGTLGLEGRCSIQLSYGRTPCFLEFTETGKVLPPGTATRLHRPCEADGADCTRPPASTFYLVTTYQLFCMSWSSLCVITDPNPARPR